MTLPLDQKIIDETPLVRVQQLSPNPYLAASDQICGTNAGDDCLRRVGKPRLQVTSTLLPRKPSKTVTIHDELAGEHRDNPWRFVKIHAGPPAVLLPTERRYGRRSKIRCSVDGSGRMDPQKWDSQIGHWIDETPELDIRMRSKLPVQSLEWEHHVAGSTTK